MRGRAAVAGRKWTRRAEVRPAAGRSGPVGSGRASGCPGPLPIFMPTARDSRDIHLAKERHRVSGGIQAPSSVRGQSNQALKRTAAGSGVPLSLGPAAA